MQIPEVRIYQTPNLIQELEGTVLISAPGPKNLRFVATNLITNLDNRTSGNEFRPLIDNDSNRASYDSCFKTTNT